jgi:hypothetical protein
MQRDDLRTLLKAHRSGSVGRGSDCPADDQFAAFVEGGLPVVEHEQFCTHLADCLYCRERLGLIGRARDVEDPFQTPEMLLARAARIVPPTRKQQPSVYRWVAAASVVLALALVFQMMPGRSPGVIELTDPDEDVHFMRSASPIAPMQHEKLAVRQHNGAFYWNSVPDSLYYEIRIVSDEGTLLWQERTYDTHWALPEDLHPVPGREYFVRLDAYLSESKSLNSDYIGFQVDRSR